MEIKILTIEEMPQAVALANGVFHYCYGNQIKDQQTLDFFSSYVNQENIGQMMQQGRLVLWGGYEQDQLVAMSGMQREGHITMLYVLPLFQKREWGRELLLEMRSFALTELHLEQVSVNAMPAWTAGYFAKRKFTAVSLPNPMAAYVPMQAKTVKKISYEKKTVSTGWLLGTMIGTLVLSAVVAVGFILSYMGGMV